MLRLLLVNLIQFIALTPKSAKFKTEGKNLEFHFCKIVKYKQHYLKVLLNSYHLNGHTLGFHPQTQKLLVIAFIDSRLDSGSERVKVGIVYNTVMVQ